MYEWLYDKHCKITNITIVVWWLLSVLLVMPIDNKRFWENVFLSNTLKKSLLSRVFILFYLNDFYLFFIKLYFIIRVPVSSGSTQYKRSNHVKYKYEINYDMWSYLVKWWFIHQEKVLPSAPLHVCDTYSWEPEY